MAKSLSDALFVSGAFACGVGAPVLLPTVISGARSPWRISALVGTAIGLLGVGRSLICLLGADAGPLLGLAIAAGWVIVLRAATTAVV